MTIVRLSLVLAALSLPIPLTAARYFVSPCGSSTGDGSRGNPWDLQSALSQPSIVRPGDTIWLLAGTYGDGSGSTIFESNLTGTDRRPIVVRQFPGGRATINGGLRIYGAYTWYWGFEITSSITDRTGQIDGTSALKNGIDCFGPGTRLINLVIHDTRQGIGMWSEAVDSEIYGNLIFNNGFQAPDRGHGHGIYVQNKDGLKLLADNIIFNQFGIGISAYSSQAGWVRGLELDGNVVFNSGVISTDSNRDDNILFASGSGVDRIVLDQNLTYHTPNARTGYSRIGWEYDTVNGSAAIRGNYWIGGQIAVMLNRWKSLTFENNVTYSVGGLNALVDYPLGEAAQPYQWNGNSYFGTGWFSNASHTRTFPDWVGESGFDHNSTFTPGTPKGVWTFVRPNYYEPQRATITIYNWDQSPSVAVDLSSFLDPGTAYQIRDVQDFDGAPVATGRYDGNPVNIPVLARPVAPPNGSVPVAPRHTAPEFAVFVVLPR
ncbi:MAG: hypothetical protein IT160_00270 [Bryobacterales bacterium]|nr:hypothetical protein [Bryobacterales bacterium]